jgi:hypothetical protein
MNINININLMNINIIIITYISSKSKSKLLCMGWSPIRTPGEVAMIPIRWFNVMIYNRCNNRLAGFRNTILVGFCWLIVYVFDCLAGFRNTILVGFCWLIVYVFDCLLPSSRISLAA